MKITASDFKLIIRAMGGSPVSENPEIYAVWTRGCRDPARYLFAFIPDFSGNEGETFKNVKLKFSHDVHVIVTEKTVIVNSKAYNIESADEPDLDVVRLFMELIRRHKNLK